MGQTLTNGVYLPDEGERNCYTGLAGNWRAVDNHLGSTDIHVTINDKQAWNGHVADTTIHVTSADKQAWNGHIADSVKHVTAEDKQAWNGKADNSALTAHTGNTTIHVTAEDKQAWNGKADASALTAHTGDTTIHVTAEDKETWNGKADASALTAHTGDTTIHVTAEDKAKWDAVTSKADDSDVVHKSGNETKSGELTLENDLILKGSTTPVIVTKSKIDLDTSGGNESISWAVKDKTENYNVFEQRLGKLSSQIVDYRLNITGRYNNNSYTRGVYLRVDPVNQAAYLNPAGNNLLSLGMPSSKFSNVYTNKINGINPGALFLPQDRTARVDISAYFTNTANGATNQVTSPEDGYIYLAVTDVVTIHCFSQNASNLTHYGQTFALPSAGQLNCLFPVRKNDNVAVQWYTTAAAVTVSNAFFIPCKGNI